MKDQHRLAQLLADLEHSLHVETSQLQYAFSLFKQLTRRERRRLFKMYEQLVGRAAIWRQHPYRRPGDLTVGILGLGLLGQAAAGKLTAAGFRVTGWARSPQQIDGVDMVSAESGLDRLLRTSDIVVSLLPLTSETRGLLDARRLSSMKTGARLINFSRGPIIVDVDLIAALDAGHIAHAVLDVFDAEPLPPTSPYWRHDSVTVLPHISAPTDRNTAAVIVADNINRYYATGALPAAIDIKRGY